MPKRKGPISFYDWLSELDTYGTKEMNWAPMMPRSLFREWRTWLLEHGFAAWYNPEDHRQGWRLISNVSEIVAAFDAE